MPSGTPTNNVSYPSLAEIGQKWTKITIERHQNELRRLKILDTRNLFNTITGTSSAIGVSGLSAKITYALYGKYVDMGVGRGVAIGKRKSESYSRSRRADGKLLRYKRKPKKWYSKVISKEQVILASIMTQYYANNAMKGIVNIPRKIEI